MKNPDQLKTKEDAPEAVEPTPEAVVEEPPRKVLSAQEITAQQQRDQQELQEARDSLEKELEKPKQWRAERKPREEWYEERDLEPANAIDAFQAWLKSFTPNERRKNKENQECQKDFSADRSKYLETTFDYTKGAGVEGRVAKPLHSLKSAILAKGFHECSGLVFQTKDGVSVVHISPNTLRGTFAGGERVMDENIDGHIKSALKILLNKNEGVETTNGVTELTPQEIEVLQKMANSGELRSTMFAGEDQFVPHEIAGYFGQEAKWHKLPSIKTDIHYVGNRVGTGYAIHASPDRIYCIGANNAVMEQGKNFPPTMYEFKERK